jgi:proline dehydrogenase
MCSHAQTLKFHILTCQILTVGIGSVFERIFAGRWIAGPTLDDAMRRTRQLNALGMGAIINYMGEEFREKDEVADAVAMNLRLIRAIRKAGANASVSLKPTQLGLRIGKAFARSNYNRIVGFARKHGVFVWLDAESQDTVDDAISVYVGQARKGGVGVTLQAYLRRSEADLQRLISKKAVVRLVKGAYKESARVAFVDRKEVTRNYLLLMRQLFAGAREFTIATHDSSLINEALKLNRSYRRRVTYAMLNGIRNGYAATLAERGNRVALYVPFGPRWIEYSVRRLREESHLLLVLRSLLGG